MRSALQHLPAGVILHDTQRVIALESGFASWPKLVAGRGVDEDALPDVRVVQQNDKRGARQ